MERVPQNKAKTTMAALAVAVSMLATGCSDDGVAPPTSSAPTASGGCTFETDGETGPGLPNDETPTPKKLELDTNRGDMTIELEAGAPCTAKSFGFLASKKYFDNTSCHRLTTEGLYVLQCGDPTGKGTGGPGYTIPDENLDGATYPAGTVAMANTGQAHTGGSQFFLVYKDTQLPAAYTPFGKITDGLGWVQDVARAQSDNSRKEGDGKPVKDVTIKKLRAS